MLQGSDSAHSARPASAAIAATNPATHAPTAPPAPIRVAPRLLRHPAPAATTPEAVKTATAPSKMWSNMEGSVGIGFTD